MLHSARQFVERAAAEQPVPLDGWAVDVQHAGRDLLVSFARSGATQAAPAPLVHVFPYAEQLLERVAGWCSFGAVLCGNSVGHGSVTDMEAIRNAAVAKAK